ncbi:MAG: hypothetical protein JW768_11130 [Chitinispirillaceae bacterium]|nr:hypothetical protein [Chitinispirillaceae bacterium]
MKDLPKLRHNRVWIMLAVLGCLSPLNSQQWRTTGGPDGGDVNALVQCGNSIFAGTHSGVWKSTDEGRSWRYSSGAAPVTNMCALGRYIFEVTYSNGVWRSGDDGVTWEPVTPPIDPDRRVNMIGAALGVVIAGAAGGSATLFISTDSGTTWKDLNRQEGFPTLYSCSSMESMGSFLFLSGNQTGPYGGVIRSADSGKTWERVNEGLTVNTKNISVLGKVDTVLLAGRKEWVIDEGCIFASYDNGYTWEKAQIGLPISWFKRVLSFGNSGKRIFAAIIETSALITKYTLQTSVYVSNDHGATWQRLEKGLPVPDGNCFLSLPDRLLLAPRCGGIYAITGSDTVWQPSNTGLSCMPVSALCVSGNRLMCSAFYHFVFGYDLLQNKWQPFPAEIHNNTFIVASDSVIALSSRTGVQISTDNGATFAMTDTAWIEEGFKGAIPSFWGKPLLIHEGYVFCTKWDGIYRTLISENSTLRQFENTKNTVSNEDWYFFSGRKQTMVAGFAGRLFLSQDTGRSWDHMTDVCTYPTAACFPDPANDSLVLVAEYNAGVYRSNDGGQTWSPPVSRMPRINTFASWRGVLFAGIKGLGVQISYDTGATWTEFNTGLPTVRFITDLLVVDTLLYAATDGSSVWEFNLNELSPASVRKTVHKKAGNRLPPSWRLSVTVAGKGHVARRPVLTSGAGNQLA